MSRSEGRERVELAVKAGIVWLVFFSILIGLFFVWRLVSVFLLVFAGILLATIFRAGARLINRFTPIPMAWSVVIILLISAALIALAGSFLIPSLLYQANQLAQQLPQSIQYLTKAASRLPLPQEVLEYISRMDWSQFLKTAMSKAGDFLSLSFSAVANLFIILFAGIYFAFAPGLYLRGIVRLFPPGRREAVRSLMEKLGSVLRWWMAGQFLAMAFVGMLTVVGLWLLGIPLFLILGIFAGILDFIPYIGPALAFIPVVLIAFPQGFTAVIYVLALYAVVQALESYVLTPLIQREAVSLPPVLTLFSQIILGLLAGFLGIVLATPLMACVMVLVINVYIEGLLERGTG